jgi:hypothetical protein
MRGVGSRMDVLAIAQKAMVNSLQDHYDRKRQIAETVLKCKIRITNATRHKIPN